MRCRQVHSIMRTEQSADNNAAKNFRRGDDVYAEFEISISQKDCLALRRYLRQRLRRHRRSSLVAIQLLCRQHVVLPWPKLNEPAFDHTDADLGPLKILQNRDRSLESLPHLLDALADCALIVMRAMRKDTAGHVHCGSDDPG